MYFPMKYVLYQTLHPSQKSSAVCSYVDLIHRRDLRDDQPTAAENIKEHSLIIVFSYFIIFAKTLQ